MKVYLEASIEQATTDPNIDIGRYFEIGSNIMITYIIVSTFVYTIW